jgi:hypothetical protein
MQEGVLWKLPGLLRQSQQSQLRTLFFSLPLQGGAKMVRHHPPTKVFCQPRFHAVFVQITKRLSGFSAFSYS